MLATNHVLVGGAIGAVVEKPLPAFAAGFFSHFLLDAIPHYGPGHNRHGYWFVFKADATAATVATIALVALAPPESRAGALVGAIGSLLPDSDKPLLLLTGKPRHPRWFIRGHQGIQHEHGRGWQEVTVAVALSAVAAGALSYAHWRHSQRALERMFPGQRAPKPRKPARVRFSRWGKHLRGSERGVSYPADNWRSSY